MFAAIAERAREFIRSGPRQRVVAPFSSDGVDAGDDPAVDHDAAADTGTENDAENRCGARTRAVDGLRQGEAVGIIGEADRTLQSVFEVCIQPLADETAGVGVLHTPRRPGQSAWYADAELGFVWWQDRTCRFFARAVCG